VSKKCSIVDQLDGKQLLKFWLDNLSFD